MRADVFRFASKLSRGCQCAFGPLVTPAMGSRLAIAQRCWLTPDLARKAPALARAGAHINDRGMVLETPRGRSGSTNKFGD